MNAQITEHKCGLPAVESIFLKAFNPPEGKQLLHYEVCPDGIVHISNEKGDHLGDVTYTTWHSGYYSHKKYNPIKHAPLVWLNNRWESTLSKFSVEKSYRKSLMHMKKLQKFRVKRHPRFRQNWINKYFECNANAIDFRICFKKSFRYALGHMVYFERHGRYSPNEHY